MSRRCICIYVGSGSTGSCSGSGQQALASRPGPVCSLHPWPMDIDDLEQLADLAGLDAAAAFPAEPALANAAFPAEPALANAAFPAELDMLDALANAAPPDRPAGLDVQDIHELGILCVRRQPPLQLKHAWRSPEAIAHARHVLERTRQAARESTRQQALHHVEGQLEVVAADFPQVAQAVGLKRSRSSATTLACVGGSSRAMPLSRAESLIRAAFVQSVPRGLGVKHERLVAFAADLVQALQSKQLLHFLRKCAWWRHSSAREERNIVIIGYSHESDGTCQQIAQHRLQVIGRPSSQRLPTEVINQQGTFRIRLARVAARTGEILDTALFTEPWHSTSCVVLQKTSPFILAALERGMPFEAGSSENLAA